MAASGPYSLVVAFDEAVEKATTKGSMNPEKFDR
jgi:hypothetical protein